MSTKSNGFIVLNVLIVDSFIMSRGRAVCTHVLSRILLLHLFPQTGSDTAGGPDRDRRMERQEKFNDRIK